MICLNNALKPLLKPVKIGDGKIFVYDIERVIRVRTGEENEEAI